METTANTPAVKKPATPAKVVDITAAFRAANPELLPKMNEKALQRLIGAVMSSLAAELKGAAEGRVRVPGLGIFAVKTVQPEGKPAQRRVTFRPLPAKGAGQGAARGAGRKGRAAASGD